MTSSPSSNDYSRSPVPASAMVSGWQVALTKLGVVLALPGFMMGAELGARMGLEKGALVMGLGGLALMAMAMFTGTVAARSHLSTSLITQFAFGRLGGRVVNAVLASTLIGWFGVTAQIFGESLQGSLSSLHMSVWPAQVYVGLGGALMIATTLYGFSALQRLSDFTIPLLFAVLLIAVWKSFHILPLNDMRAVPGTGGGLIEGVSALIGGLSAGICVFPDYSRFARSPGHARLAAGVTFGAGLPVVLVMSAIASIAAHQSDIILILMTLGLGLPALLLLVFKAWATNSGNLYSASLGLATIFRQQRQAVIVLAGGILGVALAVAGITNYFVPFLLGLSIAIPPIAGIYVCDFFLLRGQSYDLAALETEAPFQYPAFIAWGLGVLVAVASSRGLITLTTMPAADSILVSFLLYLAIGKTSRRKAPVPHPEME